MHHPVDIAVKTYEQTEFSDVLDLTLDDRACRVLLGEALPRIGLCLLETQRNTALGGVDLEHLDGDLLGRRENFARMHILLGPAHLGDMDEAFYAILKLDEGAVIGNVGDAALDFGADRVFGGDALPRVLVELLHAERDALGLGVDADDLHLHGLTYRKHVGWMIDTFPGDIGNMEKAVDAPEIDECAVIGDILDDTVDDLAFREILNELRALLGSGLLHDGAPRYDDIAAASIHLEDLKGLTDIHEGADIADRANVDLAAGQEGYGTAQIDGEAAFDPAEDHPIDTLVTGIRLLKSRPGLL